MAWLKFLRLLLEHRSIGQNRAVDTRSSCYAHVACSGLDDLGMLKNQRQAESGDDCARCDKSAEVDCRRRSVVV